MKMGRLSEKRTLLVTGGLGFIGSHFIELCLQNGHTVYNIDKQTYAANTDLEFEGEYHYIKDDIAKIEDIPYCDIVVNFAAESHVDNSISKSDNFIQSNTLGVYNLIEIIKNKQLNNLLLAWKYSPPLFVQISTDEVFGDILEGSFKENARHLPSNPYSATKSAAEQLVVAWARTYNLPFIITRTTNNYGPRQFPEKLIPRTITNILNDKKVPVHGNGEYIRNWIHVLDNINGLYRIVDEGEESKTYHLASDEEYSVREIVEMICELLDVKYEDVVDSSSDRSGADLRYALNYDSILSLGWEQKYSLKESLKEIIVYYRNKK